MSQRWRIHREQHGVWGLYYGQTRVTGYWCWDLCIAHIDAWRRKFGGA